MPQLACQFCGRPRLPAPRLTNSSLSKSNSGLASRASRCRTANLLGHRRDALPGRLVAAGQGRFGLLEAPSPTPSSGRGIPGLWDICRRRWRSGPRSPRACSAGRAARETPWRFAAQDWPRPGPSAKKNPWPPPWLWIFSSSWFSPCLQVEDDGVAVGRDAACNVLREQLLAVEPNLQPVVAAEAGGRLRGLVGRDRAEQVGRHLRFRLGNSCA